MEQREKWQADLAALLDKELSATSSELHKTYANMLRGLKASLADYVERYEELSFSKRLEVERLFKTARELAAELAGDYTIVGETIRELATASGEHGYLSVWYQLEQVEGLYASGMGLDRKFIEALVKDPVAGATLSERLYRERMKLAKMVHEDIVRGIIEGRSYGEIARRIAERTEASYRQALRIARTEAGRVRSEATQKGYKDAVDSGVYLSKRWIGTLDMRTRPEHRFLDGQVVPWDGDFTSINGEAGLGPRLFGSAHLDINCRCSTEAIIDGAGSEVRRDNETGETLDYYLTYEQWHNLKTAE